MSNKTIYTPHKQEQLRTPKDKCSCINCRREISTCNISKHFHSKSCLSNIKPKPKRTCCEFCFKSFELLTSSERANHTRWCVDNPNRERYVNALQHARSHISDEDRLRAGLKIKDAHSNGKYTTSVRKRVETRLKNGSYAHSDETKKKLSEKALNSNHQRVCKRSHTFVDKIGRRFTFDSSWEDALATRLDALDILWERPPPIKYTIHGTVRNYFPDFYLPEYNVYLDPKNPYVQKVQSEKISILKSTINLIILGSKHDCESFDVSLL